MLIQRPFFGPRQAVEHGRPAFRIGAGADLALGLVVDQHAAHHLVFFLAAQQTAVESDGVAGLHAQTEGGVDAVDLDAALGDPGLDVAARADAHACQDLLQLFAERAVFFVLNAFVHAGHLPVEPDSVN